MSSLALKFQVRLLRRKRFLEEASKDQRSMEFKIHDLLIEFAEECKFNVYEPLGARCLLYVKGTDVPPELEAEQPPHRCWPHLQKLAIHNLNKIGNLKLSNFPNLQMLSLGDLQLPREPDASEQLKKSIVCNLDKLLKSGKLAKILYPDRLSSSNLISPLRHGGNRSSEASSLLKCRTRNSHKLDDREADNLTRFL